MGKPRRPEHSELLELLRGAVQSGVALCPISDVIFLELMKQTDPVTKLETTKLVDELSLGIAILSEQSRIGTELAHTMSEDGALLELPPLAHLVWVRICFVLGFAYPSVPAYDEALNLVMQKVTIDTFWQMSLQEFVLASKDPGVPANFEVTAAKLNMEARAHAHEIRSFEQAFVAEIGGMLNVFKGHIADVFEQLYEKKTGTLATQTVEQRAGFEKRLLSMSVNMFRFARKKMAQRLPSLYVHAMCHAAARWDRQRNLDGHDLFDFHHASAAVGYCDAFFTENPLRVFLTAGHVALDREYGCRIISNEAVAIDYVRGLNA